MECLHDEPTTLLGHDGKGWATSYDRFIGKIDSMRKVVVQTINASDSDEEKLHKLFVRAQKIHNTEFDIAKTVQEVKREKTTEINMVEDVLKHGVGNKLEVNLLYVALVRAAGFDAGIVWVRSRTESRFQMDMTEPSELDENLVYVKAGNKEYYLDPGNAFCPFGIGAPWFETGTVVFRPTNQGGVFDVTPDTPSSKSLLERRADLSLDAEGSLSGTLIVRFMGQRAYVRRVESREDDETGRKKSLQDEIKGWLPSDAKYEITSIANWNKIEEPLEVQGRITLPSMGQVAGKRLLLPLGLYLSSQRQIFDSATRKQAIYFDYPTETVDDFAIHLPAEWQLSTIPAPQIMNPGGGFQFEISAKREGDSGIRVKRRLVINGMLFQSDAYKGIRDFFHSAKLSDDQQLVLQSPGATIGNLSEPKGVGGN